MPMGTSESVNSNPGQFWSQGLKFPSRAEVLGHVRGELESMSASCGRIWICADGWCCL